jgi:hypothetical protein
MEGRPYFAKGLDINGLTNVSFFSCVIHVDCYEESYYNSNTCPENLFQTCTARRHRTTEIVLRYK